MRFHKHVLVISGLVVLSGCAKPLSPTMSEGDITASAELLNDVSGMAFATSADVAGRNDTAKFSGYSTTGDINGDGVLSDLAMTVDFGNGTVRDAKLSNLNVIEGGTPSQTLSGALTGDGTISGSGIDVSLSGEVSGVKYGLSGSASGSVDLAGTFRNDAGVADAIVGTLSGALSGKIDVNLNGTFVVTED